MEKASRTDLQARHDERRQKRIREQKIRRYTFFSVLGVIAVLLILLFTPFFNIENVEIKGNTKVTEKEIVSEIGDLEGRNLFRTGGGIKKKLLKITYIEKVAIKKKLNPPTLTIEITERKPVAQFEYAEGYIVIDSDGRALEKKSEKSENIAVLEGIKVVAANIGEIIEFKDEEIQKNVFSCIQSMQKADIIKDITVMSFKDMSGITFNYQSRIDVKCGTHIDFQKKLSLFNEMISQQEPNARGTVDLSKTGRATYLP